MKKSCILFIVSASLLVLPLLINTSTIITLFNESSPFNGDIVTTIIELSLLLPYFLLIIFAILNIIDIVKHKAMKKWKIVTYSITAFVYYGGKTILYSLLCYTLVSVLKTNEYAALFFIFILLFVVGLVMIIPYLVASIVIPAIGLHSFYEELKQEPKVTVDDQIVLE